MGMEYLETVEEVLEREWTVEGIPVLSARVSLPRPAEADHDKGLRRIGRYYRQFCRSYIRYCERFLYPQAAEAFRQAAAAGSALPQYTAQLSYRVTCNQSGLWSLYADSRERGLLPRPVRRGDTWDLRTGAPVPLGDFFPGRTALRRTLPDFAEAEIRRQLESGSAAYREDWRRQLHKAFSAGNFYVTPEGLHFFYQMYALAPAVEGIPDFFLPWETLGAMPPARFLPPPLAEAGDSAGT